MTQGEDLTHINEQGRARMVDVSAKEGTQRVARAAGFVHMVPATLELVRTGGCKKGDVLAVAQVAGIMAAKRCCCGQTGVEMEALTAASVAGLTIYDMLKAVQRDMVIDDVGLLEKSGGKSGHFVREGFVASETITQVAEVTVPDAPLGEKPADGIVVATSISTKKGTRKVPQESIRLEVGLGVAGDAHAGAWHRMVSLLPEESVDEMRELLPKLAAGDFAENILTRGLSLKDLPVGTVLEVGECELAMTQIGKKCHSDCAIKKAVGKCVMPTDGVFAVVTRGGTVRPGDPIRIRR